MPLTEKEYIFLKNEITSKTRLIESWGMAQELTAVAREKDILEILEKYRIKEEKTPPIPEKL